jgi:hypothetical protein
MKIFHLVMAVGQGEHERGGDIVDFEASIYAGSSAFILIHVFSPLLLLLMCVLYILLVSSLVL